ncbi:hypothetical protein ACU4GD_41865 [Cupriavidus basilensis]
MTAGYTNLVKMVIKRFAVALVLFVGMIALAVVMMRSSPDFVSATRGPGLSARGGDHAGRGEPGSHRGRCPSMSPTAS